MMEQEIQIFKNEQFGEIRTMLDEKGEPLFVGMDVAKVLGYSNYRDAIRKHVDNEDKDGVAIRDAIGRDQKMVVINESGLYALILSSKLPQAKAFKRWVTSEVLPQIRRTGGYIPTKDGEGRELSAEEILERAHAIIGRTLQLLNAPNEYCLTATEVARSWGMDVGSFNRLLQRMGIQYRRHGRWNVAKELEPLGLTESRHFLYYSLRGERKMRQYTVWTPQGVNYLNRRVLQSEELLPRVIQQNFFITNS